MCTKLERILKETHANNSSRRAMKNGAFYLVQNIEFVSCQQVGSDNVGTNISCHGGEHFCWQLPVRDDMEENGFQIFCVLRRCIGNL